MSSNPVPAAKFLRGLGIIGAALQDGEQPLPKIRERLLDRGFKPNEITIIFDAIKSGCIRGIRVNVRREVRREGRNEFGVIYWELKGEYSPY